MEITSMKLSFMKRSSWLSSNSRHSLEPSFIGAAIDSRSLSKDEFNLINQTSDDYFRNFRKILNYPTAMPYELISKIFSLVILDVIDLVTLVELMKKKKYKQFHATIIKGLRLSIKFYISEVILENNQIVQNKSFSFDQYPNENISRQLREVLFKFMKENSIQFTKVDPFSYVGNRHCFDSADLLTTREINTIKELAGSFSFNFLNSFEINGFEDDARARSLTALKIHSGYSLSIDFSHFRKLSSLTLFVPVLLSIDTAFHCLRILETAPNLHVFNIDYEFLFPLYKQDALRSCGEYSLISDEFPDIQIKFSCFTKSGRDGASLREISPFTLKTLRPIHYFFESICFEMNSHTLRELNEFPNIKELIIYPCLHYKSEIITLDHHTLKVLRILGNLFSNPVNLDISMLTSLREINMRHSYIDSSTFTNSPSSLQKITLINSKVIDRLEIPSSVTCLSLSNSYPVIGFNLESKGIELELDWKLQLGVMDFGNYMPLIQSNAEFINMVSFHSKNGSPKYCNIIPLSTAENVATFSYRLEYEEVIQDCLCSHPVCKTILLEILNDEIKFKGEVLRDVTAVCMLAFRDKNNVVRAANNFPEDKERIARFGVEGVSNFHLLFDKELRYQIEMFNSGMVYTLKTIEARRTSPPIPHYFSCVSPASI